MHLIACKDSDSDKITHYNFINNFINNFFPSAPYLHVCHKSDPQLTECMKKSIETLRPYLVRGIPELNIPSIDPINIGDLLVSESTQSNGIRITAKNIKSYGSGGFRLRNLEWVNFWTIYNFKLLLNFPLLPCAESLNMDNCTVSKYFSRKCELKAHTTWAAKCCCCLLRERGNSLGISVSKRNEWPWRTVMLMQVNCFFCCSRLHWKCTIAVCTKTGWRRCNRSNKEIHHQNKGWKGRNQTVQFV